MKVKINKFSEYYELLGVVMFFSVVVFVILLGTGTLTCGIHMVDDHEFLEFYYKTREQGVPVTKLIGEVLRQDMRIRYRPLYYVFRILVAYLFGANMLVYSIINAIEVIICMVLLYYCSKIMGAGRITSILFSFISMIGYQSVVWWKLGPQESLGSMLFAAGLYSMLKWLDGGKAREGIISLLLFLLMCDYKESYILLLPFCGLYVICIAANDIHKLNEWKSIFAKLRDKYWYIACLVGIFSFSAVAIFLTVGITDYGGFNVKESLSIRQYLKVLSDSFSGDLKWYKYFSVLFIAILLTFWDELKKLWKEILLFVAFLLPQFALYAQTGISERYMLPATIGYSWFFIVIILKWKPLTGKRKILYMSGIILLLAANARAMIIEADYFRYRGESITGMLEVTEKLSDEGNINILSCFRPNEEGNRTVYYWMLLNGHDNVYYWTEDTKEINKICDPAFNYDLSDSEIFEKHKLDEMDVVLMYNQNDRHYCYQPSLESADFEIFDCGSMTIWIRKGSIVFPKIPDVKKYIYAM